MLVPFQGLFFAETTCLISILEVQIGQLANQVPNFAFPIWVGGDYYKGEGKDFGVLA